MRLERFNSKTRKIKLFHCRELFKDVVCVYFLPSFREHKMRIEKAVRALNPVLHH